MYECIENIENIDVIHKSIDVLSSKSIGAYENWILASPSRDWHVCNSLFQID